MKDKLKIQGNEKLIAIIAVLSGFVITLGLIIYGRYENKIIGKVSSGSFVISSTGINKEFIGNKKITLYTDFLCPDCKNANNSIKSELLKAIDSGYEVKFNPLNFLTKYSTEYSENAAAWTLGIAAFEDKDLVLKWMDKLYSIQPSPKDKEKIVEVNTNLEKMAKEIGVKHISNIKNNLEIFKKNINLNTKEFRNSVKIKQNSPYGRVFVPYIIMGNDKVLAGEDKDVNIQFSEVLNKMKLNPCTEDCNK